MANHQGSEGVIRFGTSTTDVQEVRSWTFTATGDTIEDTTMGDGARTYRAGLTSWSGSFDCYWDETDTTGQNACAINSEVTLKLYPEGTGTGATYYSGTVIITGITRQASFDGMVEASYTFQGKNNLTITN